jgi:hypothetical protein
MSFEASRTQIISVIDIDTLRNEPKKSTYHPFSFGCLINERPFIFGNEALPSALPNSKKVKETHASKESRAEYYILDEEERKFIAGIITSIFL